MMRLFKILFAAPMVLALEALPVAAQSTIGAYGDWSAYVRGKGKAKTCYAGSEPKKSTGKYKKRDETYVLVTHRPADKTIGVVSIRAGYTYKTGTEVEIAIDGRAIRLYIDRDHAWAYDSAADKKLVSAMKAGTKMVVRGTSSRGTLTTDTYSLKGFTAAYGSISKACRGK